MQKVESAVEPRPQATPQKKLLRSSPSSAERPSRGTGALAWTQEVEVGGAEEAEGWGRSISV